MDEKIYREYVRSWRGAAACHGLYRADRRGVLRGAGPQDAWCAAGDGRGACEREHHQKRQGVIVPNTNGQRSGIAAAAAAGIVSGNADAQLQVLASLTPEQVDAVGAYLQQAAFNVRRADKDYVFDIQVRVTAGADSASVEIADYHTNVIRIEKNGVVQFHKDYQESGSQHATDRSLLTVEQIIAFANEGGHCRRAGDAPAADRL